MQFSHRQTGLTELLELVWDLFDGFETGTELVLVTTGDLFTNWIDEVV
jgi:hypothetical protein